MPALLPQVPTPREGPSRLLKEAQIAVIPGPERSEGNPEPMNTGLRNKGVACVLGFRARP